MPRLEAPPVFPGPTRQTRLTVLRMASQFRKAHVCATYKPEMPRVTVITTDPKRMGSSRCTTEWRSSFSASTMTSGSDLEIRRDAPSPATLPCREHDGLEGRPKVGNVKYETPDCIEPGRSEDNSRTYWSRSEPVTRWEKDLSNLFPDRSQQRRPSQLRVPDNAVSFFLHTFCAVRSIVP